MDGRTDGLMERGREERREGGREGGRTRWKEIYRARKKGVQSVREDLSIYFSKPYRTLHHS